MGKKVYTRRTRRGEPQVQSFVTSSFKDYKDVTIVASSTTLMAKMRDCPDGRVAEWSKAPVLKTGRPARVSWVRIPPLPPHVIEITSVFSN
jgi:hypothetical protein